MASNNPFPLPTEIDEACTARFSSATLDRDTMGLVEAIEL